MKLESISVAGKDANQKGVGKKFLIISITLTVLLKSQSDDDEIPRNFDASALFKYLSIKKENCYFPLNSKRLSINPIVYQEFRGCSKEINKKSLMLRTNLKN